MTRCADCGRTLVKPPALLIGNHAIGPVCARRYIVRPTRTLTPVYDRVQRHRAVVVDESQLALELEFA